MHYQILSRCEIIKHTSLIKLSSLRLKKFDIFISKKGYCWVTDRVPRAAANLKAWPCCSPTYFARFWWWGDGPRTWLHVIEDGIRFLQSVMAKAFIQVIEKEIWCNHSGMAYDLFKLFPMAFLAMEKPRSIFFLPFYVLFSVFIWQHAWSVRVGL